MKPKIYIISTTYADGYLGFAVAADGTGLASHFSSSRLWLKHDMGLTLESNLKHRTYRSHYPQGYELVDYLSATDDELKSDPDFMAAIELNKLVVDN